MLKVGRYILVYHIILLCTYVLYCTLSILLLCYDTASSRLSNSFSRLGEPSFTYYTTIIIVVIRIKLSYIINYITRHTNTLSRVYLHTHVLGYIIMIVIIIIIVILYCKMYVKLHFTYLLYIESPATLQNMIYGYSAPRTA